MGHFIIQILIPPTKILLVELEPSVKGFNINGKLYYLDNYYYE